MIKELELNTKKQAKISISKTIVSDYKMFDFKEQINFFVEIIKNGEPVCGFEALTDVQDIVSVLLSFDNRFFFVTKSSNQNTEFYTVDELDKKYYEEALKEIKNSLDELKSLNIPHKVLFEESIYS